MTNILEFNDYRKWIKVNISENKARWGLQTKLSQVAGCQPAYLTLVLKNKTHLTIEQLLNICHFWNLSEHEIEYALLLQQLNKAGTETLRKYTHNKLDSLKKNLTDISERLKKTKIHESSTESTYYSSWHWSAIHILLTIPEYQTSFLIAQRLRLPEDYVIWILEKLFEFQLIQKEFSKNKITWKFKSGDIHISKNSPLLSVYHQHWRLKAIEDSCSPFSDSIHFTSVYSLSRNDYEKIKIQLLKLIENLQQQITVSPSEEIATLTLDFFKV